IFKVIKEKQTFLLLMNLLLASFQKRIAEKFGVTPGQDMINALAAAEKTGAEVVLADRELRTTLARTWKAISLWGKFKLMFQSLFSIMGADEISEEEIEQLKQEDLLQMLLAELEKSQPGLRRILIDERDRYLAHKIKNAPGQKIVAVVGAGHVPGIRQYWSRDDDITELDVMPPPGVTPKVLKWGIPLAIVAVFIMGFVFSGPTTGMHMLGIWIVANSIPALLGALIIQAHPLTMLTSAVAAPLTSISPFIGAGWVAGLVEALLRRPTVGDLEDLSEDITTLKGFWKNRVTRVLLVVVFVNLGSAVGTFAAIPLIARLFGT
ncbi:MAG: TraB family protein, partial [Desulfosudaceae bacterium]